MIVQPRGWNFDRWDDVAWIQLRGYNGRFEKRPGCTSLPTSWLWRSGHIHVAYAPDDERNRRGHLYILIALQFEERDLVDSLGDVYVQCRTEVRMIVPLPKRHR